MKNMMLAFALSISITACSKKAPSCEEVFQHTKEIAGPEMGEMMEKGKDKALEKCEKLSSDAKKCAMDAKSVTDLQKCPRN